MRGGWFGIRSLLPLDPEVSNVCKLNGDRSYNGCRLGFSFLWHTNFTHEYFEVSVGRCASTPAIKTPRRKDNFSHVVPEVVLMNLHRKSQPARNIPRLYQSIARSSRSSAPSIDNSTVAQNASHQCHPVRTMEAVQPQTAVGEKNNKANLTLSQISLSPWMSARPG